MPMYDRYCNDCGELFTVTCKIAEKDTIKPECPFCSGADGSWRPSMPMTSIRPDRLMSHKKDAGFSEVLSKIKERNKRTNLATGRNTGQLAMD